MAASSDGISKPIREQDYHSGAGAAKTFVEAMKRIVSVPKSAIVKPKKTK